MSAPPRTYSRLAREALALLGKEIRLARKNRHMTERDLAERAGIARSTLQLIEKGDPKVEIGLVFEVASLAGAPLFDAGQEGLGSRIERVDDKLALLPRSIRFRSKAVKDDF